MRTTALMLIMLAAMALSQTGCTLMNRLRSRPAAATPTVFSEAPSREQLLQHFTDMNQRVSQLQSDVRVSLDGMPTLRGTLAVESPNRLRLNAGLLGVPELGVDVGSNEDVFWFWTRVATPGDGPGLYYARHDQYQSSGLHQTIPIEPSWLISALGLLTFQPNDRIEGPIARPQDGLLELRTYRTHGSRTTVRVSVIEPDYGWVRRQTIYDSDGRLVAYADAIKFEHYPEYDVSLPRRIVITALNAEGTPLKLTIDASRFNINSLYGDPAKLWQMPAAEGVPRIDLANSVAAVAKVEGARADRQTSSIYDYRTSTSRQSLANFGSFQLR